MANSEFVLVPSVAVLKENDELTPSLLQQIVEKCNKRIMDTGDECPLVIGHTHDGPVSEDKQPEVVGFASHFRIGTIGNVNPKACIFATFKFFKDTYEKAKKFPRRSVELWKDLTIDPIALLGPTTPKQDLGLLFAKNDGDKLKYYMQDVAAYSSLEEITKQVSEYIMQLAPIKWAEQMMKNASRKAEEEGLQEDIESQADVVAGGQTEETADVEGDDNMANENKEPDADRADEPKEEAKSDAKDKFRMERDQARTELARYQKAHEDTKAELETLKRKFRRAERERDLTRLESEGISFDMVEELDLVTDMTDESYARHLERMRKRYQRTPVGVNLRPANIADFGGEAEFTKADLEKAVEMTLSKGIKYEDALQAVRNKV